LTSATAKPTKKNPTHMAFKSILRFFHSAVSDHKLKHKG